MTTGETLCPSCGIKGHLINDQLQKDLVCENQQCRVWIFKGDIILQ